MQSKRIHKGKEFVKTFANNDSFLDLARTPTLNSSASCRSSRTLSAGTLSRTYQLLLRWKVSECELRSCLLRATPLLVSESINANCEQRHCSLRATSLLIASGIMSQCEQRHCSLQAASLLGASGVIAHCEQRDCSVSHCDVFQCAGLGRAPVHGRDAPRRSRRPCSRRSCWCSRRPRRLRRSRPSCA